jgi:ElaA protein
MSARPAAPKGARSEAAGEGTGVSAGVDHALRWTALRFAQLDAATLYEVLRLRSEIFVVEQNCVFQDMDGQDAHALHLMAHDGRQRLVAYARLFDAGVTFAEASIGRVVTRADARGGGLGHALIAQALAVLGQSWGVQPVRIGAQAHLAAFYARHGFHDVGKPYLEDGIPHLEMVWTPSATPQ